MENATPPAAAPKPSQTGTHRLILAASAAGALATLCWAGLQVRAAKSEARLLQDQLAELSRSHEVLESPPDSSAADLARRLAAADSLQKHTADKAAARVTELENVIIFLRQENTAAQQTIVRLSRPEPDTSPPAKAQPVKSKQGSPLEVRGSP